MNGPRIYTDPYHSQKACFQVTGCLVDYPSDIPWLEKHTMCVSYFAILQWLQKCYLNLTDFLFKEACKLLRRRAVSGSRQSYLGLSGSPPLQKSHPFICQTHYKRCPPTSQAECI